MEFNLDKPLVLDEKNNRLKSVPYRFGLVDSQDGQYYRNIFPYTEVPKVPFNDRYVPMQTPKEVWMTDTSSGTGSSPGLPTRRPISWNSSSCSTGWVERME